ncbi:MAG: ClpXP protease specificity-enhancing factor SspB [Magnetococcus sp. MYC-9]
MEKKPLPDKASVIRLLLETEGRVMVCLDATQKGVDVPRRFANDPGLILVFNSTMPQPIHFLPEAVASELRFGGIPHYCVVPYAALWSAFNPDTNHGVVWPDSMPESVLQNHGLMQFSFDLPAEVYTPVAFEPESQETPVVPFAAPGRKGVPFLQVIDGGGGPVGAAAAHRLGAGTDAERRPHLRLVE